MSEFLEFVYSHFPHRWLNKKAEGTKKLFTGLERSVEYASNWTKFLKRNHSVRTAKEIIPELENEYGLSMNPSYEIEFRRKLIIAHMRLQDSPITKIDFIQMLETLGLENCTIENYHNKYSMIVNFKLPDNNENRIAETKSLIEKTIRAHISLDFNAIVNGKVSNLNSISFYQFSTLVSIQNLNIKPTLLNGRKLLDGSWKLQTLTKCIHLNRLKIGVFKKNIISCSQEICFAVAAKNKCTLSVGLTATQNSKVKNEMSQSIRFYQNHTTKEKEITSFYLIIDTMWRLQGAFQLDGKRNLNAQIIKVTL